MFLNHNSDKLALKDSQGRSLSFKELLTFSEGFYTRITKRTLIFILCDNTVPCAAAYLASLENRIVPLLLSKDINKDLLKNLIASYNPEFIFLPSSNLSYFNFDFQYAFHDYALVKTDLSPFDLNEELSLLLSTSGSTGSPKLVRHSYKNIIHSVSNISKFLEIQSSDKPLASLPIHYTMGLSVLNSYFYKGATIHLSNLSILDKKFWKFVKDEQISSFTGVPYSFDLLYKLRFFRMDLPHLKVICQGGGKLNTKLFESFSEHAQQNKIKFFATYGQTEGTARMAYLPPIYAIKKTCSIGISVPSGKLSIVDNDGIETYEGRAEGEMVYRGENVTLGYAEKGEDLIKGDENNKVLKTGDIAKRDEDGFYYIIGRKNRFAKIFGIRINLDELELLIKSNFELNCYCSSDDTILEVLIDDKEKVGDVSSFIEEVTGLFHKSFEVKYVENIKRNEAGKVIKNQ